MPSAGLRGGRLGGAAILIVLGCVLSGGDSVGFFAILMLRMFELIN